MSIPQPDFFQNNGPKGLFRARPRSPSVNNPGYKVMENNRWSHLDMFGMEKPDAFGAPKTP